MVRQTTPVDDFVVGQGCLTDPTSAEVYRRRAEKNEQTLAQAGPIKPTLGLTGSFIYAHPPDYRGRPTLHYTVADWRALFRELKELGMDTLVWQASAWQEFNECYYPSKALSNFRQWNVMEPMIQAASDEGMTLYLGCYGVLGAGDALGIDDQDISKATALADLEIECYKELCDLYGGGFQGFYLTSEVAYFPTRVKHTYDHFAAFFNRVTDEVKSLTPDISILASPGVLKVKGHEQDAVDCLLKTFADANIDIFAPQDCIGQGELLQMHALNLSVWSEVCQRTGSRFWSNVETFSITDRCHPVIKIGPAKPERVLYQMATAEAEGATKLITWEAMHFLDPNGTREARELRKAMLSV